MIAKSIQFSEFIRNVFSFMRVAITFLNFFQTAVVYQISNMPYSSFLVPCFWKHISMGTFLGHFSRFDEVGMKQQLIVLQKNKNPFSFGVKFTFLLQTNSFIVTQRGRK